MRHRLIAAGLSCLAYLASFTAPATAAEPIKVKVFIAAMFEI
ncbi:hypothetical protein ACI2JN_15135 [Ochrobactrum teleogrylli]